MYIEKFWKKNRVILLYYKPSVWPTPRADQRRGAEGDQQFKFQVLSLHFIILKESARFLVSSLERKLVFCYVWRNQAKKKEKGGKGVKSKEQLLLYISTFLSNKFSGPLKVREKKKICVFHKISFTHSQYVDRISLIKSHLL